MQIPIIGFPDLHKLHIDKRGGFCFSFFTLAASQELEEQHLICINPKRLQLPSSLIQMQGTTRGDNRFQLAVVLLICATFHWDQEGAVHAGIMCCLCGWCFPIKGEGKHELFKISSPACVLLACIDPLNDLNL